MSDLTQMENGLATWAMWATGLNAVWENAPQPSMQIGPYVILSGPTNIEANGQDHMQYTWTGTKMQGRVVARRTGDIGIRIISDAQTPGNLRAPWLFELLRMSVVMPEVTESFAALDMAVSTIASTAAYDAPGHGQRMTSIQAGVLRLLWGPTALEPATDYGIIRSISGQALLSTQPPFAWSVST